MGVSIGEAKYPVVEVIIMRKFTPETLSALVPECTWREATTTRKGVILRGDFTQTDGSKAQPHVGVLVNDDGSCAITIPGTTRDITLFRQMLAVVDRLVQAGAVAPSPVVVAPPTPAAPAPVAPAPLPVEPAPAPVAPAPVLHTLANPVSVGTRMESTGDGHWVAIEDPSRADGMTHTVMHVA